MKHWFSPTASWILYDAANSAFSTIVITAYFILFFKSVIVGEPFRGDFLWGLSIGISMALLLVASPFLGALSDRVWSRRIFFVSLTILSITATALLTTTGPSTIVRAMVLLILGNIGFEGAIIFYDSFLSQVSKPTNRGRISGTGFAVGYAGGILSLLLTIPFLKSSAQGAFSKTPFLLVALQFSILAAPALFRLRDPDRANASDPKTSPFQQTLNQLKHAIISLQNLPDLKLLLIGYLFYMDAIATVIAFAASFAQTTLGFAPKDNLILILVSNIVAVPGALLSGKLADTIGAKRTLIASLILWIVVVTGLFFCTSKEFFFVLAALVGVGLGATQATTRTIYASLIPKGSEGTYFSLTGLTGRLSSIIGPPLFGLISYLTSSQRYAVISLWVSFALGLFFVRKLSPLTNRLHQT